MLVGYARVSTRDQNLQAQIDALHAVGCERVRVLCSAPEYGIRITPGQPPQERFFNSLGRSREARSHAVDLRNEWSAFVFRHRSLT